MFTAGNIILALKIAVTAVTVLLVVSLWALATQRYRLHGRINIVVFALTITALLGLEVIARLINPTIFNQHFEQTASWTALYVHLAFSIPSALILPLMLITGLRRWIGIHYALGLLFIVLWIGTFVTGVFFLPHTDGY